MILKNYILTSDKLVDKTILLVEYFYKKYYPESKVIVLGYSEPTVKSDFVEFISLGNDTGPNIVCRSLANFFEKTEEDYFIFEVDDKPIFQKVNVDLLQDILEYMKRNGNIGRFGLTLDNTFRKYEVVCKEKELTFYRNTKGEMHKMSATNSIWKKEYFLKYLNLFDNLWQWEVDSHLLSIDDGYYCFGSIPAVTDFTHIFAKGILLENWNRSPHTSNFLSDEDSNFIKNLYKI
jgi:hypothetical protein